VRHCPPELAELTLTLTVPHPLDIPLALAALASIASASYWITLGVHVWRTKVLLPTARDGLALPEAAAIASAMGTQTATPGSSPAPPPPPRVVIIIPAHNEQSVIATLARSLKALDYPAFEVIFALDRCTDSTEPILRDLIGTDRRFSFCPVRPCPDGWAGKVNAVWSAVLERRADTAAATKPPADLLLFADADTTFDPACLRATVALLQNRKLDLLSLLSTLGTQSWYEKIVQPVAGIEMLRQAPPLRANRERHARPFANGQFMLFRREAYDALGGHEVVRDELLEDIHLARKMVWGGHRAGLLLADGMLRCRMYENYPAFVRGWKRIYTEVANRKPNRLRRAAAVKLLTGVGLPVVALLSFALGVIGLIIGADLTLACLALAFGTLALAAMTASLSMAFRMGGSWLGGILTYPLGACLVARILRQAASDLIHRRGTVWAGKTYDRPVR